MLRRRFPKPVPLLLFVKTYRKDIALFARLLRSIERHNVDDLPLVVSVNDRDLGLFRTTFPGRVVVPDSVVFASRCRRPWTYQQIIKSSVWRVGICENYLCLDSDSFFVRDFRRSDFIRDSLPLTPIYNNEDTWRSQGRTQLDDKGLKETQNLVDEARKTRDAIRRFVGTEEAELAFAPPPYLWRCETWHAFCREYELLSPDDYDRLYIDFPRRWGASPAETWFYSEYYNLRRPYPLVEVPAYFEMFHTEKDAADCRATGWTLDSLREYFLGITVQGNWSRQGLDWLGATADVPRLSRRSRWLTRIP
ncbi:MAG: DUF6492 family protein [Myxococcota bacterium]